MINANEIREDYLDFEFADQTNAELALTYAQLEQLVDALRDDESCCLLIKCADEIAARGIELE